MTTTQSSIRSLEVGIFSSGRDVDVKENAPFAPHPTLALKTFTGHSATQNMACTFRVVLLSLYRLNLGDCNTASES
jgi:hypothetical protein